MTRRLRTPMHVNRPLLIALTLVATSCQKQPAATVTDSPAAIASSEPDGAPTPTIRIQGADEAVRAEVFPAIHPLPTIGAAEGPDCPDIEGVGPLSRTALLAGRYTICTPGSTTAQPNSRPMMGAARPQDLESTLRLPVGEGTVVLGALDTTAEVATGWPASVTPLFEGLEPVKPPTTTELPSGVQGVAAIAPVQHPTGERPGAFLVVRHPDGTGQMLMAWSDPEEGVVAAALIERLLTTVALGPSPRPLGGTRVLPTGPGDHVLHIDAPDGWTIITDRGPDFFVHRMVQVVPIGQRRGEVLLYFGGHPSFRPDNGAPTESWTVLSRPVSMRTAHDGGITRFEGLADLEGPLDMAYGGMVVQRAGWFLHVMGHGIPDIALDDVRSALAEATWTAPEAPPTGR